MRLSLTAHSSAPTVDGAILFSLCKDKSCASVVWSRSVPYHIRNYKLDTSELKLSGFEGANTVSTRAISPAAVAGDLSVTASSNNSGNWLSATIDANGALSVTTAGAGMAPNNYDGTISVKPANAVSDPGVRIPVSMTLGSGFALPAAAVATLDDAAAAQIRGAIALGFNGSQAPAWTAASDKPWLILQSGGGTGAASVGYTIDTTQLASLPNFGSDSASVTFKAGGLRDAVYKVVVEKKLPEILTLTPNTVAAGQPVQLTLAGRGFQQLAGVNAIRVDNQPVASGTIVSDTQAVVTVPALSAGLHGLSIPVASGAGLVQPALNVADTTPMAAALIDADYAKSLLLYSAGRSALYTVDTTSRTLLRYRRTGNAWVKDRSAPLNGARIALSLDGATLYSTNGGHVLEERDPDTLEVRASYVDPAYDGYMYTNSGRTGDMPVTSDGRIWFVTDQWTQLHYFDTHTKTFGNAAIGSQLVWNVTYAASQDGSRLFAMYEQGVGSSGALRYDPATGKFDPVATIDSMGSIGVALSANGKYLLSGATSLYESATGRLLGHLPGGTGGFYHPALLSPDGSRIYVGAYVTAGSSIHYDKLDVIDSASMSKIGEIALPPSADVCPSDSTFCPASFTFTMSPLGDAIFFAGNKQIAVIPVPASYRGLAAARFRLAN